MHIKPPGTPQQFDHQPELHTFIGDTPQRPEPSDLELREANFSAIRAYGDTTLRHQAAAPTKGGDVLADIRTAPAIQQAQWVAGRNADQPVSR